jgi:membrane-associated phospholipid phosphatase
MTQPRNMLAAGIALLAVVVLMAFLVPTGPLAIDEHWSDAMQDIQTPFLTHLALVFNWLGRGLGWTLTVAGVAILLAVRRRWRALIAYGIAIALTSGSSALLKALTGRPRPPDGLVHPVGSSFPSGHAAYAGTTCVALVLLFTAPAPRRRWWWLLAALGIAGMAWSRTYLQVHWLSDVVAGAMLGIGIALVVFAGAQLLRGRDGRTAPP